MGQRGAPNTRGTGGPYLERAQQAFVNTHHGSSVVKLATVVGGAEERHQLSLGEEFVTVLHYLVCTANEVHVMFLQEPGDYIRSEGEGNSTIVLTPASDIFVGVRPEQVAKETTIGDLCTLANCLIH